MDKKKNLKLLQWTKKEIFLVAFTYLINIGVFLLIFVSAVHFDALRGNTGSVNFLGNAANFLNFLILIVIFLAVVFIYFFFENRNALKTAAYSEMIFLITEISLIICYVSGKLLNVYIRPIALAAMLTLFLTNSRTAIFINCVYCMIMFLLDSFTGGIQSFYDYSSVFFLSMGLSAGTIAIYCLKDVYSRLKLFLMSFIASLPAILLIAVPFIDIGLADGWQSLISGALSGAFAAVCLTILLPIFEAVFKRVSVFKYAELTDHKAKFIRKMIEQAPGTFNHAIVVSNIAEACATAIGEDALLARTCAYYHDVGKLRRPEFFKENQADGVNAHDDLTPELSANIIKSHTSDGYQLIMKNRLPKEIADVCAQHHGTMPIIYFYEKAKKFTDGEVSVAQYCYAGPKPQSKIAAIIMIADGCEAAARTSHDRSRENVFKIAKKIVSERMQMGQFDECEITLKELNIIINAVVNSLTGIYHSRIEYPNFNLTEEMNEQKAEEIKEDKNNVQA